MDHLPQLIQDLAVILITASAASLFFRFLKQPVILGYMAAGLLVGPAFRLFPLLADPEAIQTWADIGVIFMLFGLGIEFSFKKLFQVGGTALVGGIFEVTLMTATGFLFGQLLGWSALSCLFLGAMVAVSSTSIILKSFDENKVKAKKFAQVVYGILIVEDMLAVFFIVLLTALSLSQDFHGLDLVFTGAKLIFYLALWLMVGLWIIPWTLKSLKDHLTDETLLVVSVGLCLAMVVAAVQVGFSAALGAFVMGSILGETKEKERIGKLLLPVKDLFSAIFFVSIGMLVKPAILIQDPFLITALFLVVISGKIFFVTTGALLSGQSIKTSIFSGLSLAQIGEFSFILASLGSSLHITDANLTSVIIGVSVLTTFTTPYLLRHRDFLSTHIEKWIPQKFQVTITQYLAFSNMIKAHSEWKKIMRGYLLKMFLNSIVIIAIFTSTSKVLTPFLSSQLNLDMNVPWLAFFVFTMTFLFCMPFFWGIIFAKSRDPQLKNLIQTQFSQRFRQSLFFFRLLLALILLGSMTAQFFSFQLSLMISLGLFVLLFVFLARFVGPIYIWFENRFLRQIQENTTDEESAKVPHLTHLTPWEAHLNEYIIPAEFNLAGQDLMTLKLGEQFGIIVTRIQRGEKIILAPKRNEALMPLDRVSVIGSDEQLENFENFLEINSNLGPEIHPPENYSLERYLVTEKSPFVNKAIKVSKVRELTRGLIVGMERGENRILSPDSNTIILSGDLLWMVGDRNLIRSL